MDELLKRLKELLESLNYPNLSDDILISTKDKLNLYLTKFFKNRNDFKENLDNISSSYNSDYEFKDSLFRLKSLIRIIIEDIELSKMNYKDEDILNEEVNQTRKEIEFERKQIQKQADEINKIKQEILNDRERLYLEQDKFNEFKTKLEIANKKLDFQSNAISHRRSSYFWAILGGLLIILLIYILFENIDLNATFINIGKNIDTAYKDITIKDSNLVNSTIIFSFSKYLFTRLFLYSILIYAIIFCIKNYNAQMHNYIINTHKSNAFKSILSLLNTAKSEDGNDKLLIQATQAIFSHQQTGYFSNDSEPNNPNMVTNVIESISNKV